MVGLRSVLAILVLCPVFAGAVMGGSVVSSATSDESVMRNSTVRLVRLDENNRPATMCSGVSLGDGNILTAAHCFTKEINKQSLGQGRVFAEFYDPTSGKTTQIQLTGVRGMDAKGNDLAIAGLAQKPPLAQSIPLAYGACDDKKRYAVGFGLTEKGTPSSQPRVANLEAMDGAELKKYQTENHLGDPLKDYSKVHGMRSVNGKNCYGDSGGPVFCKSKGRMAVASVSSYMGGANVNEGTSRTSACASMSMLMGTSVSASMQQIERWRKNRAEATDGASGTSGQGTR